MRSRGRVPRGRSGGDATITVGYRGVCDVEWQWPSDAVVEAGGVREEFVRSGRLEGDERDDREMIPKSS